MSCLYLLSSPSTDWLRRKAGKSVSSIFGRFSCSLFSCESGIVRLSGGGESNHSVISSTWN